MRRALCAAASSARGRAGTAHTSAHMGESIMPKMNSLAELRLPGDATEEVEQQLDHRSSANR